MKVYYLNAFSYVYSCDGKAELSASPLTMKQSSVSVLLFDIFV